jgi:hypothetical protein
MGAGIQWTPADRGPVCADKNSRTVRCASAGADLGQAAASFPRQDGLQLGNKSLAYGIELAEHTSSISSRGLPES